MQTATQQNNQQPINNNGGVMVGASHDNGGIKFIVPQTGQNIEAEGGEFVVCEAALNSTEQLSMKGTRTQIAKKLNELYGCEVKPITNGVGLQAGQYVLCNAATQNAEIIEAKGTVKQIINQISTSVMCNGVDIKNQQPQPQHTMAAQGGAVQMPPQPLPQPINIPQWILNLRQHPVGIYLIKQLHAKQGSRIA